VLLGDEESDGLEIGKIEKEESSKKQILRIKSAQEIVES
jgi:hypothetical protein